MRVIDSLVDLIADTDFAALEGVTLDHAALLETLAGEGPDSFEITQVSAAQIQGRIGETTVTLSGGQLSPVGTSEELSDAINGAFAEGTLTQMTFENNGTDFLVMERTANGFSLQTGRQRVDFTVDVPQKLTGILDLIAGLAELLSFRDLSDAEREMLRETLSTSGLSRIAVTEEALLFDLVLSDQSVTLSTSGLTVHITTERVGDAQTLLLNIEGTQTSNDDAFKFSSANLSELADYWPQIESALDLVLTADDRTRIEALADRTYLNYTLEQSAQGPFSFQLNARVDAFYRAEVASALKGTAEADVLTGTEADDLLIGAEGDDVIDGGGGHDIARIYGLSMDFAIEITPDGVLVHDRQETDVAIDRLTEIEVLNFDDRSIQLGELEWIDSLSASEIASLVRLYIAYFGRAPDAEGMLFWLNAVDQGLDLSEVAGLFYDQPETRAQFEALQTTAEFIATTYARVLGRAPDADGLMFWSSVLDSGQVETSNFIQAVIDGALSNPNALEDQQFLSDKTDIGLYFALTRGLNDVTQAKDAMALFDGSASSLLAARDGVDHMYQDAQSGDPALLIGMSDLIANPFAEIA